MPIGDIAPQLQEWARHPCELTSQSESRNCHRVALHEGFIRCGVRALFRSLRHQFDPLDVEILEKAFDAAWSAVKENDPPIDFDSDEGLEAILRRELIEIARFNDVSDPETLRDILLERLPQATP